MLCKYSIFVQRVGVFFFFLTNCNLGKSHSQQKDMASEVLCPQLQSSSSGFGLKSEQVAEVWHFFTCSEKLCQLVLSLCEHHKLALCRTRWSSLLCT